MFTVPKGYEENFRKAEIVFKYQLVFDPRKKKLVRLNSIEDGTEFQPDDLNYAGPYLLLIKRKFGVLRLISKYF